MITTLDAIIDDGYALCVSYSVLMSLPITILGCRTTLAKETEKLKEQYPGATLYTHGLELSMGTTGVPRLNMRSTTIDCYACDCRGVSRENQRTYGYQDWLCSDYVWKLIPDEYHDRTLCYMCFKSLLSKAIGELVGGS